MAQVVYRDTHLNDNKYIDECFISISYLIDSSVAFENPIRFWLEISVAAAKQRHYYFARVTNAAA